MDNLWDRRRGANRADEDVARERSPGPRRRKVGRQRCCILVTTALTGAALLAILASMLIMVNGEKPSDKPLQVHVIFRHGERTPTETYPNDPYKEEENWPEGMGQLTNLGKKQIYDLGVFLRTRYGPSGSALYDGAYTGSETKVLSSYADRCLTSAGSLLAGLFPPSASPDKTQVWLDALDWQPVPIRYIEREEDRMITSKRPCPRYENDLASVYASPEIQRINRENEDLFEHLTNSTGEEINDILGVEFLYNTLEIEELRGLVLPEWVKGWYPERMKPLASLSLAIFSRTLSMKKTKSGVMLWEIGNKMQNKLSNPHDNSKINLYSAHDTTIVNVLHGLGVGQDSYKPEFAAAILIELLESTKGDRHVQVLLKKSSTSDELTPIDLPGCTNPCRVTNFLHIDAVTSPEEWDNQCQLK